MKLGPRLVRLEQRVEQLGIRSGECRKPLLLVAPDIRAGLLNISALDAEALGREQAASRCLFKGGCLDCPDPIRRDWAVLAISGKGLET